MVIYRPNRGGLAEAMDHAREFENFDEMKRHVVEEHEETWGRKAFDFDDIVIEEAHGEDRRIGWKDCRYVCVKRYAALWRRYAYERELRADDKSAHAEPGSPAESRSVHQRKKPGTAQFHIPKYLQRAWY